MAAAARRLAKVAKTAAAAMVLAAVLCGSALAATTDADDAFDDQRMTLVDGAEAALEHFLGEGGQTKAVRAALADSRGVLIMADDGVENGARSWRGLLFGRAADGAWTGPAVYTVVSGTFGRSPTERVDHALFIVRSDVDRLIAERIRFGGSGVSVAQLAPGPLPKTDLVAVTDAAAAGADPQGAFAGTVISPDQYATNALFGRPITIREAVASSAEIGDDITTLRRHLEAATADR
jgi:lipid-binding SYLF domain-containing protein